MSDTPVLMGAEHVRQYRESNGEVGHKWNGTQALILTTTGRKTGDRRDAPLIYAPYGDAVVVVASKGGAPEHPAWYLNLESDPEAEVQVGSDVYPVKARTAEGDERQKLWDLMAGEWPGYNDYAKATDRVIPVVVLDRES